jgi:hypothetical protein
MTIMTIQSQVGTVILSSGTCRFYGEPTGISNVCGLRRKRYCSRSGEGQREPRDIAFLRASLDYSAMHSRDYDYGPELVDFGKQQRGE